MESTISGNIIRSTVIFDSSTFGAKALTAN